jgi:acyl-coenzyme A thioesterase PaaI-like protein
VAAADRASIRRPAGSAAVSALEPPPVPADAPLYRFELVPHNCFVCGELNAHGLRIAIRAQGRRVYADLTLGHDHEGWVDVAHGGIVAALLDEVMEWALFEDEAWGMTAEMTVRYRRPVPVGEPIHVEGWVVEGRHRRYRTAARVLDGAGQVLANAQGTYLSAAPAEAAQLRSRYRFRAVRIDDPDATVGA